MLRVLFNRAAATAFKRAIARRSTPQPRPMRGSAAPTGSPSTLRPEPDALTGEPHAIRQHPHLRGLGQGAQGRDRQARDRRHHRRHRPARGGGVGRHRGGQARRLVCRGQARGAAQEVTLEIRDPRLIAVVGTKVEFEKIAGDCLFTEGPLWHPTGKYLLWSDMPGDHLRRWSVRDGVTTFRKPCNKSNGLTWDRQGRLLACEHASSQVSRTEPDGRITPLATHYAGKELNSPNDIVCGADGAIYFSDPPYGRAEFYGVARPQELPFQGVFWVGPDAKSPI